MTDVGHARANKDLFDDITRDFRQQLRIVWIVRATHDGLFDVGQINFNDLSVVRISIRLK